MAKFFFDLLGPKQDVWVWRQVDEDGVLLAMSADTFQYYLDCVADAKQHGFDGAHPSFRSATPGMKTGE
jgi:hypothetical protein